MILLLLPHLGAPSDDVSEPCCPSQVYCNATEDFSTDSENRTGHCWTEEVRQQHTQRVVVTFCLALIFFLVWDRGRHGLFTFVT
jgi:hypothetical protein